MYHSENVRKDSKNTERGNKKQGRLKLRLKTVLRWTRTNAKCGKISERREKDLINVELE